MTRTKQKRKEKIINFMFDHYITKRALDDLVCLLVALVSAAIFAFGYVSFISKDTYGTAIITGGVSGLTQNIALIVNALGGKLTDTQVQAIGYIAFNIPLLLLAYFKIGKRFAVFTAVNVLVTSLLIFILPKWEVVYQIANLLKGSTITRAVFAAVCTGLSSAIAYRGDISCGGIDIITYFFAMKKSTSVGKYTSVVNGGIIAIHVLILFGIDKANYASHITSIFYSIIYIFVVSLIIDLINLRNKKVKITINTKRTDMGDILISHFPHGATKFEAQGLYTHESTQVIYMIVSSYEMQKVVNLVKNVDPHSFVSVEELLQVYGQFFHKPIK